MSSLPPGFDDWNFPKSGAKEKAIRSSKGKSRWANTNGACSNEFKLEAIRLYESSGRSRFFNSPTKKHIWRIKWQYQTALPNKQIPVKTDAADTLIPHSEPT